MSYLACARHGLAEDEILDILSADKEVMADFRRRSPNSPKVDSLPVVVWVRLHGDLAFYLAEHQAQGASLLGFYHRNFLEAVHVTCLPNAKTREQRHHHLAAYFHRQENFLESLEDQRARTRHLPPTPRPANVRKAEELVYQRLNVLYATPTAVPESDQACEELKNLLTDLFFLEAKTEAGKVFDLVDDFTRTLRALPREHSQYEILQLLDEALHRDVHFIARYPTALFQCLWNTCWWYDCTEALEHYGVFRERINKTVTQCSPPGTLLDLLGGSLDQRSQDFALFVWKRGDIGLFRLLENLFKVGIIHGLSFRSERGVGSHRSPGYAHAIVSVTISSILQNHENQTNPVSNLLAVCGASASGH